MALQLQISLNYFNGLATLVGPNISGFTGSMYLNFLLSTFSSFDSHLFYPPSSTFIHFSTSLHLLLLLSSTFSHSLFYSLSFTSCFFLYTEIVFQMFKPSPPVLTKQPGICLCQRTSLTSRCQCTNNNCGGISCNSCNSLRC